MLVSLEKEPRGSASLAAVISAFVPTWITGMIFVIIFMLIRHRFPNIYAPRTYMGTVPEKHQTPAGRRSYFDWIYTMWKVPDRFLLYHQSLDTYLYLRFLRTIIFICVVGSCLTWPTLMPANATGGGSSTEFDKIGIGNVTKKSHFYAHAVMAWVFFSFIMFTIGRERMWLIGLRQAWALSKTNTSRLSSRTVLFLSAPREALDESNMNRFFGDKAVRIWPVTRHAALSALVSERDSAIEELEAAETLLIQNAVRKVKKERRKHRSQENDELKYSNLPDAAKKAMRPRIILSKSNVGKKVDKIYWLRERIEKKESAVESKRQDINSSNSEGSAAIFVEYKTLADAQQASQQVTSTEILSLSPRYLGISPKEVLWQNLPLPAEKRISQDGIAMVLMTALIIFWSIPSGFVGLVSNISYLAENVEWLAWLQNLPDPLMGLLSGLIPPLLTSLLSKYVPNIFRYIIKTFGGATRSTNELKVQKWFYIFQVTQVFLVTAVFSGAATVFSELLERAKDPGSIPELLARQLPKSSNYYLTYFIVQGTTTATDNLLNWTDLLQYYALGWLFDKTPRDKYRRYTSMKGISWGKVFPKFANFAIIAIAYSCIAPLVLGFATLGLSMYYLSYRYNLLFVIQPKVDTKGQAYTLALQHLMTGLYIAELALLGQFGLGGATGPAITTLVLFASTIIYNALMNRYLEPLEKFLPADLTNAEALGEETTPLLAAAEEGQADDQSRSRIQRLGQVGHVPSRVVDPLARFFEPHIFASYTAMRDWLREDEAGFQATEEDAPEYSEEDIKKAYLDPALTSSTPVIWLPKDDSGASENEVRESEEVGLKATDQGAWLDKNGRVRWSKDKFEEVPIWKAGILY